MAAHRNVKYGISAVVLVVFGIIGLELSLLTDHGQRNVIESRSKRTPFDADWAEWTELTCTFTHEGCVSIKTRQCLNHTGQCIGSGFERINCTSKNCKAIWTEWDAAADSTGNCIFTRTRDCQGILSSHPPDCDRVEVQNNFCPASVWGQWGSWNCDVDDKFMCHYQRQRVCFKHNNDACIGQAIDSVNCTLTNCKAHLHPEWSEWSAKICQDNGLICFTSRNRTCSSGNSADCAGEDTEVKACVNDECKVHWLEWSPWECVDTHGVLAANRVRNCSTYNAPDCDGKPYEHKVCSTDNCPECHHMTSTTTSTTTITTTSTSTTAPTTSTSTTTVPTTTTHWLDWSHWECIETASNQLSSKRVRNCSTGNDVNCTGKTYDIKMCVANNCPECPITTDVPTILQPPTVAAIWSTWSSWGCVESNGVYVATRKRNCSAGDISACTKQNETANYDVNICGTSQCPVCLGVSTTVSVPTWLNWGEWKCEFIKGTTFLIRFRNCSHTTGCDGDTNEIDNCSEQTCPQCFNGTGTQGPTSQAPTNTAITIDGQAQWSAWTTYTCSRSHGLHFLIRYRTCSQHEACVGENHELHYCTRRVCGFCYNEKSTETTTATTRAPTTTAAPSPGWSPWGKWTCSTANSLKFLIRYRHCPTNMTCSGETADLNYCDKTECPECYQTKEEDPCKDEYEDECNRRDFRELVCPDKNMATKYCKKSCKRCVPLDQCKDGPGCSLELIGIACSDPAVENLCPIGCGLCVLPTTPTTPLTTLPMSTATTNVPPGGGTTMSPGTVSTSNPNTGGATSNPNTDGTTSDPNTSGVTGTTSSPNTGGVTGTTSNTNTGGVTGTTSNTITGGVTGTTSNPNTGGVTGTTSNTNTGGDTGTTSNPNTGGVTGTTSNPNTGGVIGTTSDPNTSGVTGTTSSPNTGGVTDTTSNTITGGVTGTTSNTNTGGVTGTTSNPNTGGVTGTTSNPNTGGVIGTTSNPNTGGVTGTTSDPNTGGVTGNTSNTNTGGVTGTTSNPNTGGVTGTTSNPNTGGVTGTTSNPNTGGLTGTTSDPNTGGVTGTTSNTNTGGVTGTTSNTNTGGVTGTTSNTNTGGVTGTTSNTNTDGVTGTDSNTNTGDVTDTSSNSSTSGTTSNPNTDGVTGTTSNLNTDGVTSTASNTNTGGVTGTNSNPNTGAVTVTPSNPNTSDVTANSNTGGVTVATSNPSTPSITTMETTPKITTITTTTTTTMTTATTRTTTTPTTTSTTTPVPTTQPPTTLAPSTSGSGSQGHTIAPIPTKCAVCVGPPELCDQLYEVQTCNPPNNYCINHVKNLDDGSREISRSCGDHRTCYREWFEGSSDSDKCQNFVEDNVVTLAFECTYCCVKDECNIKLFPDLNTLYKDV